MENKLKASIIIPAFNEEQGLDLILPRVKDVALKEGYEIIVVDDGSTDGTSETAKKHGVRLIRHPYNKGYGASLKTGTRNVLSDIILIMDADGQHNPEEIKKLVSCIGEYDMAVGARSKQSHFPLLRRPGKFILNITANYLSGHKIEDLNSGFRAIKKECVLEFMHILPNQFSFSTTITLAMFKAAYNVKYLPITVKARAGGRSSVKHAKHGLQTMLLIIRVIMLFNPLKVFIPLSLILGLFGTLFGMYGVLRFHSFPKTGVVAIISGVMIFALGVLADQISSLRRQCN